MKRLSKGLLTQALFFCALISSSHSFAVPGSQPEAGKHADSVPPNELGRFLVLEYHLIQPEESRWGRSVRDFRQDLELLYAKGFRPVSISEVIDGRINLARGRKPVLLTFDDSSPGQFRIVVEDGKKQLDRDCAVGMLMEFHRLHPDFDPKAVFYVLPEAKQPHKLFGQPEYEIEKLRFLAEHGFEIGNHTLWHANLGKYDDTTVQKQLALSVEAVQQRVPEYNVRSLALPFGVYPKDLRLAVQGEFKSRRYHHEAILKVAGGAAYSPFNFSCDLLHIPRIQVPGPDLQYWLSYFEKNPGAVYISDGQPDIITFPKALQSRFCASRFKNLKVVSY